MPVAVGVGLQAARIDAGTCWRQVRRGEPRFVRVRRGRAGPCGAPAPREFLAAAPAHQGTCRLRVPPVLAASQRLACGWGRQCVSPAVRSAVFGRSELSLVRVSGPLLVEPHQVRYDRDHGVVVHDYLCCEV